MDKLRKGQRHGFPDLWMPPGEEDKIVAAFGNLKKFLGTLSGTYRNDKAVKKRSGCTLAQ